ncbi:MAG: c-type cytochrome [Bacteroidetes bacterium]|nr:c-type cytochrome [Bacteroidota bacterium]
MYKLMKLLFLSLIMACTSQGEKPKDESGKETPVKNADEISSMIPDATDLDGKTLFSTCILCHGEKAEGNQTLGAPALANQDNWYLKRQLGHFKNGIRGIDPEDTNGLQMATIAKTLRDETAMSAVVDHIKTLPKVIPKKTIEGDPAKGKQHYDMICGACHGPGAEGNEALNSPKLTGIDDWYLLAQYNKFNEGKRGVHPVDTFGAQMKLMSNSLPDEDAVNNVITYIHSLHE